MKESAHTRYTRPCQHYDATWSYSPHMGRWRTLHIKMDYCAIARQQSLCAKRPRFLVTDTQAQVPI